jgi:hypothetical protein
VKTLRKSVISIGILVLALSLVMPVLAVNVDKHVVKNIQITSNPKYDRNPCLLEAKDGTYWLFYTRGMDERGIRGFNGTIIAYTIEHRKA